MSPVPPQSVLIVRLSSIGDVVHTLPAYTALRRAWPGTTFGWAVEPAAAELVGGLPSPPRIHRVDTPAWRRRWWSPSSWKRIVATRDAMRGSRYELVLDFQGLIKSAAIARLAKGGRVVGFAVEDLREPWARHLYDRTIEPVGDGAHVVHKNLALAAAVGADDDGVRFPRLGRAADRSYVDRRLRELGIGEFIAVHPVANWSSKRWPRLHHVALGRELARRTGHQMLWLWGPGERRFVEELAVAAGPGNRAAFATDLNQLAALLRRARLFVGGDSAPLHLAVAVGTPTVALFGPTDPSRNGSLDDADPDVYRDLPCSFCFARRCPLGTRECLTEIAPGEVADAVVHRLRSAAGPGEVVGTTRGTR